MSKYESNPSPAMPLLGPHAHHSDAAAAAAAAAALRRSGLIRSMHGARCRVCTDAVEWSRMN